MTEPLHKLHARHALEQGIAAAVRTATESGLTSQEIEACLAQYSAGALDFLQFLTRTERRIA